jgi:hypothetical protein
MGDGMRKPMRSLLIEVNKSIKKKAAETPPKKPSAVAKPSAPKPERRELE